MSFKFNFSSDAGDDNAKKPVHYYKVQAGGALVTAASTDKMGTSLSTDMGITHGQGKIEQPKTNVSLEQGVEVQIQRDEECLEDADVEAATLDEVELEDGTCLLYVQAQLAEQRLQQRDSSKLSSAINTNSDLVPNVYEGGLKIWECSTDLVNHLTSLDIAFRGLKVIELGCGAGLPGLYTFVKGANTHFQDYNKEVIDYITIPNVLHNSNDGDKDDTSLPSPGACRFFAGDWSLVKDLILSETKTDDDKYDMILTSETIYCPENYSKLHETLHGLLKPGGVVYLAAKTYYFGVGGGLREFESKVKEWGVFEFKNCRQFTEGVQREILELRFKKCGD